MKYRLKKRSVRRRKAVNTKAKIGKRSTLVVNKAIQPFPQRYISKMKYSETFALNSLNGYTFAFNLNSIFDPNRTGIGHQPYGHDTLQALYNRYRVIACTWNLSFYSGGSVCRVATLPLNEAFTPTSVTNVSEVCENPRSRWAIQIPGGNTKIIRGKVYLPNLVGRTKAQYMADDRYQAQFGASPGEFAILNIIGGDISDAGTNIQCTITLQYTVEAFDMKQLAQS